MKKKLIVLISVFTIIAVIIVLFISPIAKYLVEKYDEKYTGRQITMDWAYVNPFTGYIHLSDLKIYELKSDSVFLSVNGMTANISMLKLFSKTYEISEFTLSHPRGIIIQNKKEFNFNDLVTKFSSKENADTAKAPVRFNILDIQIKEGEFYFREKLIPINYFIKNVNFESAGKYWDSDTISANFSFLSGIGGGDMKGDFSVNFKNKDYRLDVVTHKFNLNIIEQYLKDLTSYGTFSANIDADMKVKGNFSDQQNITASGMLAINDFHFGKNRQNDYASFEKLVMAIKEISPKNHIYFCDSISLSHPFLEYERYDYLDNLQAMFGKKGANIKATETDAAKFNLVIEIASYIKLLSKNFFQSNYKINRLAIYDGDLRYNDYSLTEKFSIGLYPLFVVADSIDKNNGWVNVSCRSGIKPYGDVSVAMSINPKDSGDFDIQYDFQKLPAAMFNPYLISLTSFPFDRGTFELNGEWQVRNGNIQSDNHFVVIDPRVSRRLKNKDARWLPVPLLMSFIRERGNVIDYQVPITGDLKDPKFHVRDVMFDLLENIFVNPATIPYRKQVRNIEAEIEQALTLTWQTRHSLLLPGQRRFAEGMADFLSENPDVFITISPQSYEIKEKEYILFFEAKKKFFLISNNKRVRAFTHEDSLKVIQMSVKDSMFVSYLNERAKGTLLFTIQEKCAMIVDSAIVNLKFRQLNKARENDFLFCFKAKNVEDQVKFAASQNVIPYNGFSFYKIEYKGEFPEPLIKAYRQMNELDDKRPRKKFKMERRSNKTS